MKTTIYDLLGMIKDGKAPKRIKYGYDTNNCPAIWEYNETENDYYCDKRDYNNYLFSDYVYIIDDLNEEVEILDEEDKIEKLVGDKE